MRTEEGEEKEEETFPELLVLLGGESPRSSVPNLRRSCRLRDLREWVF